MKWQLHEEKIVQKLEQLEEVLLKNRKIEDKENFFEPLHPEKIKLEDLNFSSRELSKIKIRLKKAKDNQEKVIIFGDYDADGISATAILWESLFAMGLKVMPFIPSRLQHGYGLSENAIQALLEVEPDVGLIITVDNGIVAHQALKFLAKKKIDVIITDHHQQDGKQVAALAVFHSTEVCGAAVAWFLSRELLKSDETLTQSEKKQLLKKGLELLAIATVTDLMPLIGVNRSILFHALAAIKQSHRPGLDELFQLAKLDRNKIEAYSMGFVIGPRINAMGRLANANDALRLLCTNDPIRAKKLASLLHDTNSQRQDLTEELLTEARIKAKKMADEKILIIDGDFHEGVIGLIAGKLTEEFNKPSIVISNSNGVAKASARSLANFNITEFIRLFMADILEVGGHPLAAGFSLLPEKIEQLRKKMLTEAKKIIPAEKMEKTLLVDCQLVDELLSISLTDFLEKFAPFGLANPKANFMFNDWQLLSIKYLGNRQDHQKLLFKDKSEQLREVLFFNYQRKSEKFIAGKKYDLVLEMSKNLWRGKASLQIILQSAREAIE